MFFSDLEWKIVYVGSAESEEFDQILDTVYVGPVPEGKHKFVFTADPPNPHKIPVSDVVGVTVILITCAYRGQVSIFQSFTSESVSIIIKKSKVDVLFQHLSLYKLYISISQ